MSANRIRRLITVCASATLLALANPSHAIQRFWNNPAGGSFNVAANWQLGVVPGPADQAYFSLGSAFTYPVSFPTDVSNNQLTINQNNVTFDLLSHQYQLSNIGSDILSAPIRVGAQVGDNATLRLINGTLTGNAAIVGWVSGSEDNLFVSAGATLNSNILDLGHFGIGHLTIDSGGILNSGYATFGAGGGAFSQAYLTLDGAGSRWTNSITLNLGGLGKGILTIDNGAAATIGNDAFIGASAGSTGSVTVDGTSATDPSIFTVANDLDVGSSGTAFLTVTNQAQASARNTVVGRNAGSKGTIKISDNLAEFRATNLYIAGDSTGPGGIGTVNVSNNGVLNVTGPITVWPNGQLQSYPVGISTSELRLRGGRFSAWSNFNAPVSNGGGTIEVPGSNILFLNSSLTSLANSTLQRVGTGDLWIMGTQNHATNSTFQSMGGQTFLKTNAGAPATAAAPATANLNVIVGPGNGAKIQLWTNQVFRQLTVNTASPGRQSFDLNSPAVAGAFSAVAIYTSATKADLWAAVINANRPGAPDPQDGIFDSGLVAHPNSRIGVAKLSDAHGDPYVLIRPTRIGDLNLDGTVTISDFIDLSSNFGASGPGVTWQEGDVNYDNAVTIGDFIDLSANFGASYAGDVTPISAEDQAILSAFAAAHVPEPSTLILFSVPLLLSPRPRTRGRGQG